MNTEKRIKAIMRKHLLRSVSLTFSPHGGVSAKALPDSHSPLVAKRREKAFGGMGSYSITEAQKITEGAMGEVANGMGSDIEQALVSLEGALAKVDI